MREYNVRLNRDMTYGVSITYRGVRYINTSFESKREAMLSADRTIIKNNLPFRTKKLKPIEV